MILTSRNVPRILAAAFLTFGLAKASVAAVILDTGTPDGGFFGWIGYDVFQDQSVGIAFTPTQDYTLDTVGVWMMSNDFDNAGRTYTLSLVTDLGPTNPSIPNTSNVIESWNMATAAVGWDPVLDVATSTLHPLLSAGTTYWIVADSNEPAMVDPVWVWGSSFDGYYSGENNMGAGWNATTTFGSAPGTVINATPVPEPTAMLGLLAAGGIGTLARRKR